MGRNGTKSKFNLTNFNNISIFLTTVDLVKFSHSRRDRPASASTRPASEIETAGIIC